MTEKTEKTVQTDTITAIAAIGALATEHGVTVLVIPSDDTTGNTTLPCGAINCTECVESPIKSDPSRTKRDFGPNGRGFKVSSEGPDIRIALSLYQCKGSSRKTSVADDERLSFSTATTRTEVAAMASASADKGLSAIGDALSSKTGDNLTYEALVGAIATSIRTRGGKLSDLRSQLLSVR